MMRYWKTILLKQAIVDSRQPVVCNSQYTEPFPLKYEKLVTEYPWIYTDIFHSVTGGRVRLCLANDSVMAETYRRSKK